jgi:hypothetical protein
MTWSDYMKNYGYREYPCLDHGLPFCEKCYGPDPLARKTDFQTLMNGLDDAEKYLSDKAPCSECGQVGFHKMSCDTGDRRGSTVCVHMNEPFDCPECREARKVVNLTKN